MYLAGKQGPLIVLFHGGGHTSLSWALVASKLKTKCRILSFDYRGHGELSTFGWFLLPCTGCTKLPNEDNLSLETLTNDAVQLVNTLYPADGDEQPVKILVGHSLGGAVATQVASSGALSKVEGLVVLDVVEGTAMASLRTMHMYLEKLPSSFSSLENAIQWR